MTRPSLENLISNTSAFIQQETHRSKRVYRETQTIQEHVKKETHICYILKAALHVITLVYTIL